jgi:hypothetical protein
VLLLFLWFFIVLWGWFVAKAFGGLGVTAGLAADRTAMTGMVAGQDFFETDTKLLWYYDGAAWQRIHPAGSVVQTVWVRSDTPVSYGSGGVITQLNLAITPRYANSKLLCQWVISGEAASYNAGFRVAKNLAIATNPAGFNSVRGGLSNSYMSMFSFETDYASTPDTTSLFYMDDANTTTVTRTYSPVYHTEAGGNFILNRAISDSGAAYEYVVSTGVCHEIMV